jgi:hypothetical protein
LDWRHHNCQPQSLLNRQCQYEYRGSIFGHAALGKQGLFGCDSWQHFGWCYNGTKKEDKVKVISISFPDTVDVLAITKGNPATVTQGATSLDGTVLALTDIYEPPTELLTHTHVIPSGVTEPPS